MRISFFKFNLFVFIFFIGASAFAGTNYLYSFGGAGDPEKNTFVHDFINLNRFAKKNQWQTTTLFDGDQPDAQLKVSKAIQDHDLKSFTGGEFQIQLENIATKKFKPGDKVLFVINTHGSLDSTSNGHYIVCQGNGTCDTGDLKAVIDRLQTQGVQVALIDFSCYSGQSLKMANNKTCVISAASNDDVGYGTTSGDFIKNMKSGKSLEEVYLEMRKNQWGLPRISSPAGLAAEKIIQSLAPESQQLVTTFDQTKAKGTDCNCTSTDELQKTLNQSKDILINSATASKAAREYINASMDYQKLYSRLTTLDIKIKSYRHVFWSYNSYKLNWIDIANLNDKAVCPERLSPSCQELLFKKRELEQTSPEFRQLEKDLQEYAVATNVNSLIFLKRHGSSPLSDAALKTQKYESKLYQELYRSYQGQKENPCANFIL